MELPKAPCYIQYEPDSFLQPTEPCTTCPVPSLSSPPSSLLLDLLQPHQPPRSSSSSPGTVLPHGLCMCYLFFNLLIELPMAVSSSSFRTVLKHHLKGAFSSPQAPCTVSTFSLSVVLNPCVCLLVYLYTCSLSFTASSPCCLQQWLTHRRCSMGKS